MKLFDLPTEIILEILVHVFPAWTATMSLTCELTQIPNMGILRTCRLFNREGTKALQSAFTGEFIRYDRRGCIMDENLKPEKWYRWIMQNTTTLHLYDAYFTIWYIRKYWTRYPRLESFVISVMKENTYNDPAVEMPDYSARQQRCNARTNRFAKADYSYHGYLFDELFVTIYKDMVAHEKKKWPTVEYRFHDCHCHKRETIIRVQHAKLKTSLIDESFKVHAWHVLDGELRLLHEALVQCVALQNEHGFTKSLGTLTVQRITDCDA